MKDLSRSYVTYNCPTVMLPSSGFLGTLDIPLREVYLPQIILHMMMSVMMMIR